MSHATTPVLGDLGAALGRLRARLARDLDRARDGEARGIHRARVTLRRLREALALESGPAARRAAVARRAARRLREALGPLRELDVVTALLDTETVDAAWPAEAAGRVRVSLDALRETAQAHARARLSRAGVGRIGRRLEEAIAAGDRAPRRDAIASRLAARLERRARELERALREAGRVYALAPLHRVRIAAKKLRYTLELAHDLRHLPVASDLRALRRLQDVLGRLHDRQTLQRQIAAVEVAAPGDRAARQALAAMGAALETECRALHATGLREWPRIARLAGRLRLVAATLRRPPARRMTGPGRVRTASSRVARGA